LYDLYHIRLCNLPLTFGQQGKGAAAGRPRSKFFLGKKIMQNESSLSSREDAIRAGLPAFAVDFAGSPDKAAPGLCWRHYKEHWLASLNGGAEG
jgi:hypothetical protein